MYLYKNIIESISSAVRNELHIDDNDFIFTDEDMDDFILYLKTDFEITNEVSKEELDRIYNEQNLEDIYKFNIQSEEFADVNEGIMVDVPLQKKYSLTYEQILNELQTYYHIKGWQVRKGTEYNKEYPNIKIYKPIPTCNIVSAKFENNLEYMNKMMAEYGYVFFHFFTKTEKDGNKFLYIIYNPMFPDEVNEYIRNNIRALYHASPVCNHENIVKYGFQPNEIDDDDIYYSKRVFFKMDGTGWKGFIKMLSSIADRYIDINPNRKFNIYMIRANKLIDKYKFYRDCNICESCYTEETIPYDGFMIDETIQV